jgi:hypothetical protein
MRTQPQRFVQNPAWVTDALAASWETLDDTVPAAWRPILDTVKSTADDRLSGRVLEYGCGKYGCVFPTSDPEVVLKVTSDDTEAEFAANLAGTLARPICVAYKAVLALDQYRDKQRIYLLWRESASRVGELEEVLGEHAMDYVAAQHAAAEFAYWSLQGAVTDKAITMWTKRWGERVNGWYAHEIRDLYRALIDVAIRGSRSPHIQAKSALDLWVKACDLMARQTVVPQLRELGDGMVEVFTQQHILFGDIHEGNLGIAHRPDGGHWVITDPGHIAVVNHL